MRRRLVRVRRRPRGIFWAMLLLVLSMAGYIRVSVPSLRAVREEAGGEESGARVAGEVCIEPLSVYLVSFGGYDVMNSAKVEAARYVSRGAAGYVLKREKLYVIGAGYAQREDAEKACVQLAAREGLACAVIEACSPEIRLRVTAREGQITALSAAEKALRSCAKTLGQLAFSVDQGKAALSQAQEVVKTQLEKSRSALSELERQTGGTGNELFKGFASLLSEMNGQMEAALSEKKAMSLSSRMKYCSIDMTVREIELLNAVVR